MLSKVYMIILCILCRDWCDLSKQTGLYVVNEILSGESKETILENIHGKLREVKDAVHAGEIPIDLYYITKVLVLRFLCHFPQNFFRTTGQPLDGMSFGIFSLSISVSVLAFIISKTWFILVAFMC